MNGLLGPIGAHDQPDADRPPSGFCVRLVALMGEKEYCQELNYFFGGDSLRQADSYMEAFLIDPPEDLSMGKYRMALHPAWKGHGGELNEYADTEVLESITFVLTKITKLERVK